MQNANDQLDTAVIPAATSVPENVSDTGVSNLVQAARDQKCQATPGKLTVTVTGAKRLPVIRENCRKDTPDPFVRVRMGSTQDGLFSHNPNLTFETPHLTNNRNPTWCSDNQCVFD